MPQEFQRGHTPGVYPIGLAENLPVLSVVRTVATVSAEACRAHPVGGAGGGAVSGAWPDVPPFPGSVGGAPDEPPPRRAIGREEPDDERAVQARSNPEVHLGAGCE